MALSRKTKILYGSGDTGFSLTTTIIAAMYAIFLTDVVGLRPGIVAIAIFAGRSWDYINDPIMGWISDRTRTRWGRRRPFILFGSVPFGLAFFMMWWKPPLGTDVSLAVYYAIAYVLFDTAATVLYMPYFALTPELTNDYDERTSLTSYRMFFSILASLIAFTLPLMMVGRFIPENADRFLLMGGVFALVSAAPMALVFIGTREDSAHMHAPSPNLKSSLASIFRNKPFLSAMAIYLFTWIAMDIMQVTLLYFIKYGLNREGQSDLIMATIFVTGLLTLPLWNYLSSKLDKRRAFMYGIAFWGVVQVLIVTLVPSTPLYVLLPLCALAGFGVAAAHVLPHAIIPDSIEWDEYTTGERHEGVYYSFITLVKKVSTSIAIPLALLLLEATGYQPNVADPSRASMLVIRGLTGPIPALLLIAAILFAYFYPLSRSRYEEILEELRARRRGATE